MEERGSAYRGAMIGSRVEDQRITTPLYTLWSRDAVGFPCNSYNLHILDTPHSEVDY